ncbi:hypothetical protein PWEIH_08851 [Listeria weihenstephanensis FSL R9-0317]|nr:hypothetical protein PWEIH_08851 [Listeria weihenstephanensis FSL R9-0317]
MNAGVKNEHGCNKYFLDYYDRRRVFYFPFMMAWFFIFGKAKLFLVSHFVREVNGMDTYSLV